MMHRHNSRNNTLAIAMSALLLAVPCLALDGFVVAVHYEQPAGQLGNIHDASIPGKLVRYDIRNSQTIGTNVLFEKTGVGYACLSPFGDQVAFTKPSGKIAVISVKGGPETELVSFVGTETPAANETPMTGIQWPASEGGKWLYYMDGRNGGNNNSLRRVHVDTRQDEFVVRFNRSAAAGFALSLDATPHSGTYVKRTDNYTIAIYNLARGDGDLFNCPRTGGCGESISPDGSLFTANSGWHTSVNLVDVNGNVQGDFRLNQWDGDPCSPALGLTREQTTWAWQAFRWSVNAMNWIAVHQGRLKLGSTHETYFQDVELYNWVDKMQLNVTHNPTGSFDRVGGFWENRPGELFLGYFRGQAPLHVAFADARLQGEWTWDFGDASTAKPAAGPVQHTFNKEGTFTVMARHGDQAAKAQVMVLKRRPPVATCRYVNATCVLVDFDEPVRTNHVQALFASGVKAAELTLNETGRRLFIRLQQPLKGNDKLRIKGVEDLAQEPNPLDSKPMDVRVPAWPSDRRDLVFLWEDAKTLNVVEDGTNNAVRELRVSRDAGAATLDRYGRMRPLKGRFSTGFFSQVNAQAQFRDLILANAFTLEVTLQSDDLDQHAHSRFPVRIVNCSAWHDADWEFMLGQQGDQILFSIRTTENMLTLDDKPTKSDLHGHAPILELARLPDTRPHHLIVSYVPGKLVAYLDGKCVKQTDEVKGDLLAWGYGELCFGDNHNGSRHGWLGRLEGVAIYKRFFDAEEAARNCDAYRKKVQARPVLPQAEVEAKLLALSTIPDPKKIAPYRDALMVNEYEITRVVQTSKDWKATAGIEPGRKIRVAQWGLIEEQPTGLARAKCGDARHLVLEVYDHHPDKVEEVVTSNSLEIDPTISLLYEPLP